jgi:hypothetical protein
VWRSVWLIIRPLLLQLLLLLTQVVVRVVVVVLTEAVLLLLLLRALLSGCPGTAAGMLTTVMGIEAGRSRIAGALLRPC